MAHAYMVNHLDLLPQVVNVGVVLLLQQVLRLLRVLCGRSPSPSPSPSPFVHTPSSEERRSVGVAPSS